MLDKLSQEVDSNFYLNISRYQYVFYQVVKSVQRHPRDFTSIEVLTLKPFSFGPTPFNSFLIQHISQVCIALKTVKIRNAQHELIKQWPYKNQPMKHHLTHMYGNYLVFIKKKTAPFCILVSSCSMTG